jgi:uncharacterized protein (TIGR00369 family)
MPTVNEAYTQALMNLVNTSPFPDHMRMHLAAVTMDTATVKLTVAPCHMQPFGIVHGGALATLIDTATFWAVFLRLPEDTGLVNIDLRLNYLEAVTSGTLTAQGRTIRCGRTLSYAEAGVRDEAGKLVAHGTSTLMALPGKGLDLKLKKFID